MRILILSICIQSYLAAASFEIDTKSDLKTIKEHLNKENPKQDNKPKLMVRSVKKEQKNQFEDLEELYFDSISTKLSGRQKVRSR
jgi:hypothetical protein